MPNIVDGVLPILLKSTYNYSNWEFGYYKLNDANEQFDILKITNWQNDNVFRGLSDGMYYAAARLKLNPVRYSFKKETISCNSDGCELEILNVRKTVASSNCELEILHVTKTPVNESNVEKPLYLMFSLGSLHWNSTDKNYIKDGHNILQEFADNGINSVQLSTLLTDIFQGNIDNEPVWGDFELQLQILATKSFKVFLRIWLVYPRHWAGWQPNENYWGNDIAELDEWGNKPESYAGIVPFTLADDAFRAKIGQKYRLILAKAYEILGDKLLWASPVTSSTAEFGDDFMGNFWHQNEAGNWNANQYLTTFSYNPKNRVKFQQFLLKKYGSLSRIKTVLGVNYENISDIDLPKTGKPYNNGIGHSDLDYLLAYRGQIGLDFYLFRNDKKITFASELKLQTESVNNNILYSLECGGFSHNLATLNCTLCVNDFVKVFDLMKGSSGVLDACMNPEPGYDYLNLDLNVEIADELSNFDLNACGNVTENLALYKERVKRKFRSGLELGLQFVLMLDVQNTNTYTTSLQAMKELREELGYTQFQRVMAVVSYEQPLRNALDGMHNVKNNWLARGGSETNRLSIKLTF